MVKFITRQQRYVAKRTPEQWELVRAKDRERKRRKRESMLLKTLQSDKDELEDKHSDSETHLKVSPEKFGHSRFKGRQNLLHLDQLLRPSREPSIDSTLSTHAHPPADINIKSLSPEFSQATSGSSSAKKRTSPQTSSGYKQRTRRQQLELKKRAMAPAQNKENEVKKKKRKPHIQKRE